MPSVDDPFSRRRWFVFFAARTKRKRERKREEKESVRQRAGISRKMKRDDDNRVEDLQSLSENRKAMRTRAMREGKGDRGVENN